MYSEVIFLKKDARFYFKFFIEVFKLSAFTFGGGYVIVPLMRKKFVEELKWLEEEEMLDLIGIAQSAPGAIAVNASILTGYRLAGVAGALLGAFGTVLPPLIIITFISAAYSLIRDNAVMDAMMRGMQIGVAVVVVDAGIRLIKSIIKTKSAFGMAMLALSFIAAWLFKAPVTYILIASIFIGVVYSMISGRRNAAEGVVVE